MNNEDNNQVQPTNQEPGNNTEQQDPKGDSTVTFTDEQQAAINKIVSGRVDKITEKYQKQLKAQQAKDAEEREAAVKKAQDRAKMTADQRAEAERKDREKAMQQRQANLDKMMHEYQTKSLLLDKGISVDMLPLVMGKDDDETNDNLALLKSYTDKKVQEATDKLLQGKHTPTSGNNAHPVSTAGNPWSKDHWNLTEQQRIASENPEQALQMISQANPSANKYFIRPNQQ